MTREDLIEKYVAAHADCRWMDAGDLNDLLHSFVEELDSLVTSDKDLEKAADNYIAPIENDEGLDYINFNGRDIKDAFIAGANWQKEQKPAERLKDALMEWAKYVLKRQEEELAKYDGPSYGKASTMGRIDAYKVLIAKLNSL